LASPSSPSARLSIWLRRARLRLGSDFKSALANPNSAILISIAQNKFCVCPFVIGMKGLKRYTVDPTRRTPRIVLETGRIFIVGRSIPENPGEFYRPIYEWISQYVQINGHKTSIELGFEYINTSSTKWIYNIIKEIAEIKNLAENVRIIWYYDLGDEDMCELGFILKSLVECPFFVVESEGVERTPDDQVVFDTK
jgi:hypothetical protein